MIWDQQPQGSLLESIHPLLGGVNNIEGIEPRIESTTSTLMTHNSSSQLSKDVIVVKVESPDRPDHLTVVVLPGIVRTVTAGMVPHMLYCIMVVCMVLIFYNFPYRRIL
jgi:hypothetical protein